mmetsp:Transcript_33341/g.107104  ORF Transcript_33341/g.107104 Transcript_33341/m.107104 type:complete len:200 (-) Transcript_33341:1395-1994(-)
MGCGTPAASRVIAVCVAMSYATACNRTRSRGIRSAARLRLACDGWSSHTHARGRTGAASARVMSTDTAVVGALCRQLSHLTTSAVGRQKSDAAPTNPGSACSASGAWSARLFGGRHSQGDPNEPATQPSSPPPPDASASNAYTKSALEPSTFSLTTSRKTASTGPWGPTSATGPGEPGNNTPRGLGAWRLAGVYSPPGR